MSHASFRRTFGDPLGTCMIVPQDGSVFMIFYVKPFIAPTKRYLVGQAVGRVADGDAEVSQVGQMVIDKMPSLMRPEQGLSVVEIKYPKRARQRMEEAFASVDPDRTALLFLAADSELIDGVSWLLGLMQMKPFPEGQGPDVAH